MSVIRGHNGIGAIARGNDIGIFDCCGRGRSRNHDAGVDAVEIVVIGDLAVARRAAAFIHADVIVAAAFDGEGAAIDDEEDHLVRERGGARIFARGDFDVHPIDKISGRDRLRGCLSPIDERDGGTAAFYLIARGVIEFIGGSAR